MHNRCLIVFVKYPQAGLVKTRLAQHYGDEFAAGLYKEFLFDILNELAGGPYQLQIYFDPPEKEVQIIKILGGRYSYRPQQGYDLGEKMKNAFTRGFTEGFESLVLIGSDLPDLPRTVIESAFDEMDNQHDAVIGPAADGGYYLIGQKKDSFVPEIFLGVPWGTASVLQETVNILQAGGCRPKFVAQWNDIDTPDDLLNLIEASKGTMFAHSRTMQYLKASKLFPC